jgi:hypothetical protein
MEGRGLLDAVERAARIIEWRYRVGRVTLSRPSRPRLRYYSFVVLVRWLRA